MVPASSTASGDSLFKHYNRGASAFSSSPAQLLQDLHLADVNEGNESSGLPLSQDQRPSQTHQQHLLPRNFKAPKRLALELSSQPSQASQDNMVYTPDYTPQEQHFQTDYDPSNMPMEDDRSPAPSPHRLLKQKRPRSHLHPLATSSGCSTEDESTSQPSQSQSRSCGEPSTCSKAFGLQGRPPIPRAKEVLLPLLRNPYLNPQGSGHTVYQPTQPCLPRHPTHFRFSTEYALANELGHGNFSVVYKAVHKLSGMSYAIKTNREPIASISVRNQWVNEIHALAAVQTHPNIIGFHDAWWEPDRSMEGCEACFIKLELCGASLNQCVKAKQPLKEPELVEILRQMASALKHVHDLGMLHLDVKPGNIYTYKEGHYKLGDFGLAMPKGGQRVGTSEGDSKYLAPECLRRDYLTSSLADRVDVFALGATIYELALGMELPKHGTTYQDIRQGKLHLLPHVGMRLQQMIKKMLHHDPAQRPSADAILRSPQVNSGGLVLQPTSTPRGS